ncbi:MAG: peptide chain release factor N(5)-glutamine methyltransferase [Lachnospiraceae bacterium]|nr:peptide chain release factor N(5)-glutamine methyltransferase [Lachnospiraceae bacterium]
MTYRDCYEWGKAALEKAKVAEFALDARFLLEDICGTNRNDLLVHGDRDVTGEQQALYEAAIEKRAQRIPLQHITGTQDFMGLTFRVNENVLIPRQDTEILVEEILPHLSSGVRILDMCTGSGCILISLLHYSLWAEGVGADISPKALEVAKRNREALLKPDRQVSFVESNLFENVEGTFDIIVSNPPYIRTEVIKGLMPEVKDHEPMLALDGSEDGLYFYRRIAAESKSYLRREGRLFFEIGYDQAEEVKQLMEEAGFIEVTVVKDFAGLDRVVHGYLA